MPATSDLAGNALEWTDDYLGCFWDTTITNYVGAPEGGSTEERVVKGGSYINAMMGIKLYLRGDLYMVTGKRRRLMGFRPCPRRYKRSDMGVRGRGR